ncbi:MULTISPECIES: hypothetical protein [Streptomyces]|uniref:hypothetical protein n=1 Tax=Streptomyces TaxID=1883 RepID=UPI0012FF4322|nr:hypothetical protein [[Kitasatospora] papulosa]
MFSGSFTVSSADDGFRFDVRVEGRWQRSRSRHHNPEAVASSYVIGEFTRLAADCRILDYAELQHRANARLGREAVLADEGVRVRWATVRVHVTAEDLNSAHAQMRLRARARADSEIKQLRVAQAVAYRDQLRTDPTLVLAQLLLESPETVNADTVKIVPIVAEQVAMFAPGAAWVQTAHLLEEWYGKLKPDAKQFVIGRLCTALTEFEGEAAAERLKEIHGLPSPGAERPS